MMRVFLVVVLLSLFFGLLLPAQCRVVAVLFSLSTACWCLDLLLLLSAVPRVSSTRLTVQLPYL
jgi:hypothetical protein